MEEEAKKNQELEAASKQIYPDGLHHSADGRKWHPDNGQEVSGVNIYAQQAFALNTGKSVQ